MLNEVIDQNLGNDVIKRVFAKTGIHSEPVLLGTGTYGIAYTYQGSNHAYKLTEDVSEAAEAMKISGINNKHLANVYGVYELQYDLLQKRMFLIILEKLRTDVETLNPLFRQLMYLDTNNIDIVSLIGLYGRNRGLYNRESQKVVQQISQSPELKKLYDGLLGISTDLARHNIKSTDYHPSNLGYKQDGTLAFFDMGFSNSKVDSHSMQSIELEERIFERIMTFMPNAKAMEVKKKCQLAGNGDGTSTDCNQGDIDNIILKEIKDVISENVQLFDKNLLKTNKLSEEDKNNIISITNGDNYTYAIGEIATIFLGNYDQNKKNEVLNGNVGRALREYYMDMKTYDPNVFPIKNYDPYLKTMYGIELAECLSARRESIRILKTLPSVYYRNLMQDIRTPRDASQMKYGLEREMGEISKLLKPVMRLSQDKQEMYFKKIFSSKNPTFSDVKKQLENLDVLFLNHSDGIDEMMNKIKSAVSYKDAKLLYNKNNIVVVDVLTSDGMKELGCGATWCFTTEGGEEYWKMYADGQHVNIVYNFNLESDQKERMVVVLPTMEVYNMYNEYMEDGDSYLMKLGVLQYTTADKPIGRKKKVREPEEVYESARHLEPEDYSSVDDVRINNLIDNVIKYKFSNSDGTVKYVAPEDTDDFYYYINSAYYNQPRYNEILKNKNSTIFHNNLNKMHQHIKNISFDPKSVSELNAYHGTPNKFDAFSMDMIGSSDGREIGGWGLYFSDDESVASQYSTRSGGVMRVELPNGNYLDFDEMIDDQLAQEILRDENIPEDQREQFQNDFNDDAYRYDITNKQVYEWLSYILGGGKQASKYLLTAGYTGTKFRDKTNPEATNYVLFDTRRIKNLGYLGDNTDEMDEYLGYVQEMVKFELMQLNEKDVDNLTNSVMKSLLNENQQMQSNGGFDLKTMDNMRSFSKRKQYADQTLQKIGTGSARIVYQMPDGNVLKLAKNEKGLGQNDAECGLGQDHYFSTILSQVKDCDTNDLWVVSEKANKIAPKRFKELTGITPEELSSYISDTLSKPSWFKLSPERKKEMGEIDFVNQMTELAHSYDLAAGDLGRISSYGEVNRDGQPEVVLIDYGATESVMNKYYNKKPKERNIWEGYFDEVDIHDMVIDELHGIIGEHGAAKTDINSLPFKKDVELAGGKIFSVGGAVRDSMLGRDSKDLDILITGIQEDKLEEILKRHGRVDNVGKSFGVIKFNHPSTGEIDIALPRTEVPNGQGGYRGFDVKPDHTLPIEKDLERRDFTINAIAKDDSGKLIDPYGGLEDIKNKQIKMVNPNAFGDDPVRMLRAVQFASRFGFIIEPNTMASIQQNASKIKQEPPERYLTEFAKIVEKGSPEIGAKLLAETGLFTQIFGVEPKFNEAELKGVKTMGEFLYQLTKYSIPDPADFYKTILMGDNITYSEMKAYDLSYKDKSNNPVQNKLTVFAMYKTFPNSVTSNILPENIKKNIKEMTGLEMPFSFKDLQVNGNDALALGYSGLEIKKLLKDLLIDIYSGKIRNNRELLMRQITPLDMNPTKIN